MNDALMAGGMLSMRFDAFVVDREFFCRSATTSASEGSDGVADQRQAVEIA